MKKKESGDSSSGREHRRLRAMANQPQTLAQAQIDIDILLAQIEYLEEITETSLEDEDAALIAEIRSTWLDANEGEEDGLLESDNDCQRANEGKSARRSVGVHPTQSLTLDIAGLVARLREWGTDARDQPPISILHEAADALERLQHLYSQTRAFLGVANDELTAALLQLNLEKQAHMRTCAGLHDTDEELTAAKAELVKVRQMARVDIEKLEAEIDRTMEMVLAEQKNYDNVFREWTAAKAEIERLRLRNGKISQGWDKATAENERLNNEMEWCANKCNELDSQRMQEVAEIARLRAALEKIEKTHGHWDEIPPDMIMREVARAALNLKPDEGRKE